MTDEIKPEDERIDEIDPGYRAEREIKDRILQLIDKIQPVRQKFADEVHISFLSLREYYRGTRHPNLRAIARLMHFTRVSGDWLILGRGSMFPHQEPPEPVYIDEGLLGRIAQQLENAYVRAAEKVRSESHAYGSPDAERPRRHMDIRMRTVIAANVYNRISHLPASEREAAILREIDQAVRVPLGLGEGVGLGV